MMLTALRVKLDLPPRGVGLRRRATDATIVRAPTGELRSVSPQLGSPRREAGRGLGLIQTHQPDHPVMRALIASDRDAFYAAEIDVREKTSYPPFGRLASLLVSGPAKPAAESFARRIAAPKVHTRLIAPSRVS